MTLGNRESRPEDMTKEVMWVPRRAFQYEAAAMRRPEMGVGLECSGTVRKLGQPEQSMVQGAGANYVGFLRACKDFRLYSE